MLLLVAAFAAAAGPVSPDRQARATVRILRIEPLRFAEIERQRPQDLRTTVVRTGEGRVETLRLVEYQ